jgi:hypothetical protein
LLSSGFQLERARALIADPGDIPIEDLRNFVDLSAEREQAETARREDTERRLREADLERERRARQTAERE